MKASFTLVFAILNVNRGNCSVSVDLQFNEVTCADDVKAFVVGWRRNAYFRRNCEGQVTFISADGDIIALGLIAVICTIVCAVVGTVIGAVVCTIICTIVCAIIGTVICTIVCAVVGTVICTIVCAVVGTVICAIVCAIIGAVIGTVISGTVILSAIVIARGLAGYPSYADGNNGSRELGFLAFILILKVGLFFVVGVIIAIIIIVVITVDVVGVIIAIIDTVVAASSIISCIVATIVKALGKHC